MSATDLPHVTFAVPDVEDDETFEYQVKVSSSLEAPEPSTEEITIKVLNRNLLEHSCATPADVYEGGDDFEINCTPNNVPSGSVLRWQWAPRAPTTDLAALTGIDDGTPTFLVPRTVDATASFHYTVMVSADNYESASDDVTVTVRTKGVLAVEPFANPLN